MGSGIPVNRVELVYRREKAVLSTKELAELSGVALSTCYGIEAGYYERATPKTIRRLARVLRVKPDVLVDVRRPRI